MPVCRRGRGADRPSPRGPHLVAVHGPLCWAAEAGPLGHLQEAGESMNGGEGRGGEEMRRREERGKDTEQMGERGRGEKEDKYVALDSVVLDSAQCAVPGHLLQFTDLAGFMGNRMDTGPTVLIMHLHLEFI